MKRSIFFDLDGTLWDAVDNLVDSWNESMKNNNLHYRFNKESMLSFMGLTPLETVKIAFNDVDEKLGMLYFSICLKDEIEYLKKYPGKLYENEEEVLKRLLKKYPLYIVSNCGSGYIENYFYSLNMKKYFKGKLCVGDTGKNKWENILILKNKEGFDDVIYVGDTLKDKKEAEKACAKFIHANYGFGRILDDKYYVNSFNELESIIEKLFN